MLKAYDEESTLIFSCELYTTARKNQEFYTILEGNANGYHVERVGMTYYINILA